MPTIATWLDGIGRSEPARECPFWPPDLFAIAGALLKRSGAYLRVFEHGGTTSYVTGIQRCGEAWRQQIESLSVIKAGAFRRARPRDVLQSWRILFDARDTPINKIPDHASLAEHLVRMALIADAASAGIGIDGGRSRRPPSDRFLSIAEQFNVMKRLHSFCWDIPEDVICVLGKQHTPQRGATFRSLTHHLSLYFPNDIEARWAGPYTQRTAAAGRSDRLNLLLLPWPVMVRSEDFSEVRRRVRGREGSLRANYFRFRPKGNAGHARFARSFRRALEAAKRHADQIDAVILPELALSYEEYEIAEQIAVDEHVLFISGVRYVADGGRRDLNYCALQPAGTLPNLPRRGRSRKQLIGLLRLVQSKHHRWCLDRDQIVNYQLGGRLPASRGCWENIELTPRTLNFVTLNRMTWSALICEDLARQDPAADLIRAIGPNLLIALLMDGPQLNTRWAARYASVLAEDPGCSVLTLTSLGMAGRCRPVLQATGKRAEPSRAIALWRDAEQGEVEIALDSGDDACVLSLECRCRREYSADGRDDGEQSRYPVYAGFRSFRTAE